MLRSQKTATLEDGSSYLFGTCSVWFLLHQWAKKKPPAVAPSRWVRCGSAGAEHVTAIAHVIVRHVKLAAIGLESGRCVEHRDGFN